MLFRILISISNFFMMQVSVIFKIFLYVLTHSISNTFFLELGESWHVYLLEWPWSELLILLKTIPVGVNQVLSCQFNCSCYIRAIHIESHRTGGWIDCRLRIAWAVKEIRKEKAGVPPALPNHSCTMDKFCVRIYNKVYI